jgi:hypothetical protein
VNERAGGDASTGAAADDAALVAQLGHLDALIVLLEAQRVQVREQLAARRAASAAASALEAAPPAVAFAAVSASISSGDGEYCLECGMNA